MISAHLQDRNKQIMTVSSDYREQYGRYLQLCLMQQYVNKHQDAFFSNSSWRKEEFVSNLLHQYIEPSIGRQTAKSKLMVEIKPKT